MSRAIVDVPTTLPAASQIGEMVSETGKTVPSFRRSILSKFTTVWPAATSARIASASPVRSSGLRRMTDLPIISSLE